MKNVSITAQLKMQEILIVSTEIQPANQLNVGTAIQADIPTLQKSKNNETNISMPDLSLSSVFGLLTPDVNKEEGQTHVKRKKKKPRRGFRR